MIPLKFDQPETTGLKILALGAHCDDIEIGCGGTLLKWIENYPIEAFRWVVFTSDEIRQQEAVRSARQFLMGVEEKEVTILSYRDAFLSSFSREVKEHFEELKNSFEPTVIFTHFRNDRHQDHRLISDLTWNTFRHHLVLEYEIPKYDGDLGIPNCFCHLSEALVKKKIDLLLDCFESQKDKHWFDRQTFTSLLRIRGLESANPGRYAEAFYLRKCLI